MPQELAPEELLPSAASIYVELVAPLIESLLQNVMVIGLLAVTFSYAAQILAHLAAHRRDENPLGPWEGFVAVQFKRAWLLVVVSLFAAYNTIAYGVWADARPPTGEVDAGTRLVLLVLPIDLIQVAIVAALFGALSAEALPMKLLGRQEDTRPRTVITELSFLFSFTALWHFSLAFWWVSYGLLADAFSFEDIVAHGAPGVLHSLAAWAIFKYRNADSPTRMRIEKLFLVLYSLLAVGFYALRLGQHVVWWAKWTSSGAGQ